jgi:murein DD-endopeptidase MepM/ murein hydrolase activator NlpD
MRIWVIKMIEIINKMLNNGQRHILMATTLVLILISAGTGSAIPTSDGFDYPVGSPYVTQANDGDGWYNAQDFRVNGHLGEDWNGEGGGDTDCGEPVYAISKGTIVYAADAGSGWGNVIIVRHDLPGGTQVESLYGHLQSMSKTSGDVARREQIGTIGKDGWPYCHLHFEIRFSNCPSWGSPGPGYSTDATGWTDPSDFIDSHRHLNTHQSLFPAI